MAMERFAEPNWAQKVIADAAGLIGSTVAVRLEDETKILFLKNSTRDEILVNKKTGEVMVWKNNAIKKGDAPTDQSRAPRK